MTSLQSLPTELFVSIFSHVDYTTLTANLRATCRLFHSIISTASAGPLAEALFRKHAEHYDPRIAALSKTKTEGTECFCFELHPYIRASLSHAATPRFRALDNAFNFTAQTTVRDYLRVLPSPGDYDVGSAYAAGSMPSSQVMRMMHSFTVKSFLEVLLERNGRIVRLWYTLGKECNYACYADVYGLFVKYDRDGTSCPMWEMARDEGGEWRHFGMGFDIVEGISFFVVGVVRAPVKGRWEGVVHDHRSFLHACGYKRKKKR